jgi:hypothetical protein
LDVHMDIEAITRLGAVNSDSFTSISKGSCLDMVWYLAAT